MEQRSQERQKSFIAHIARKLGRTEPLKKAPLHLHRGAPDFWREHDLSKEERVQQFVTNWRNAGGEVEHLPDMDTAKKYIVDLLIKMKARHVLRQNELEWEQMQLEEALPHIKFAVWDENSSSEQRLADAAGADVGLAVADHAVSVTGSIVFTSSANRGRSVTLLPTALVALIPVNALHTRIGHVTDWIEAQDKKSLPAGIHFVSGPSRSADIENDLTIGVHGPGVVYALVIG